MNTISCRRRAENCFVVFVHGTPMTVTAVRRERRFINIIITRKDDDVVCLVGLLLFFPRKKFSVDAMTFQNDCKYNIDLRLLLMQNNHTIATGAVIDILRC